jgi:aarF domain-containing kinase
MSFRLVISKIARRTAYGIGGVTIAGGTAITAYTCTEQGLGLRREIRFWSRIVPIVFDYWWHISSSSPLVKFRDLYNNNEYNNNTNNNLNNNDDDVDDDDDDDDHPKDILENTVEAVVNDNDNNKTTNEENNDHHEEYKNEAQKVMYNKLHNRNASKILSIMIDLGSLYIKLGQVLSVTALPVPSQYREKFRQLQSSVPGHSEFETVIKPTLEREFGRRIEEIFESIEEIPCGAASIGQAHRAKLLLPQQSTDADDNDSDSDSDSVATGSSSSSSSSSNINGTTIRDVVIKVQYPDAKWQVPADVQCVGDFLQMCVYFGVVDESSSKLSYEEFSRQFLSELDYKMERQNLQEVYESSLDKDAPYIKRGVEIPKVFPELCTSQVITMTYLPGPKFEEEARKQLESLGINTSRGVRSIIREETKNEEESNFASRRSSNKYLVGSFSSSSSKTTSASNNSWMMKFAENMGTFVGVDNILSLIRLARKALLWSTAAAVRGIQVASNTSTMIVSPAWLEWAKNHENAASQAEMLEWTNDAIDALFDIHGYQIFNQGLFNADAHPGNILIIQNDDMKKRNTNRKLGLIDYGQCKRLNLDERRRVAKLIVSVADDESDEQIASNFRDLGIITKNDSTRFLSSFARLMFGKFRNEYLKRDWHKSLHEEDEIVYFPNELSMVYRASLLLRGLAMSFQINVSVGEKWRQHAQTTLLLDQVGCENLES